MGGSANTAVNSVSETLLALERAAVPERTARVIAEHPGGSAGQTNPSHVPAFVLGTVIGAFAGALLGTFLSPHTRAYLVGLYQLVSRRLTSAERDKLRFELLLQ